MSVHLHATTIFYITEDAPPTPFKKGHIFCNDAEGNLYSYSGPNAPPEANYDKKNWPARKGGKIELYRDYWRHAPWAKTSAFRNSLDKAPRTAIK